MTSVQLAPLLPDKKALATADMLEGTGARELPVRQTEKNRHASCERSNALPGRQEGSPTRPLLGVRRTLAVMAQTDAFMSTRPSRERRKR